MQRPSWNLLKEKWGNLFFFDTLSLFLSRLYEEKGKTLQGVLLFDPYGRPLPPKTPPVYIIVIYKNEVDFLKNVLQLRVLDHDGIIEPLGYGMNTFRNMLKRNSPLAKEAFKNGIVLYELEPGLEVLM